MNRRSFLRGLLAVPVVATVVVRMGRPPGSSLGSVVNPLPNEPSSYALFGGDSYERLADAIAAASALGGGTVYLVSRDEDMT